MSYGYCPKCNGKVISRERRMNGNDRCENGHVFPSKKTLNEASRQTDELNLLSDFANAKEKYEFLLNLNQNTTMGVIEDAHSEYVGAHILLDHYLNDLGFKLEIYDEN